MRVLIGWTLFLGVCLCYTITKSNAKKLKHGFEPADENRWVDWMDGAGKNKGKQNKGFVLSSHESDKTLHHLFDPEYDTPNEKWNGYGWKHGMDGLFEDGHTDGKNVEPSEWSIEWPFYSTEIELNPWNEVSGISDAKQNAKGRSSSSKHGMDGLFAGGHTDGSKVEPGEWSIEWPFYSTEIELNPWSEVSSISGAKHNTKGRSSSSNESNRRSKNRYRQSEESKWVSEIRDLPEDLFPLSSEFNLKSWRYDKQSCKTLRKLFAKLVMPSARKLINRLCRKHNRNPKHKTEAPNPCSSIEKTTQPPSTLKTTISSIDSTTQPPSTLKTTISSIEKTTQPPSTLKTTMSQTSPVITTVDFEQSMPNTTTKTEGTTSTEVETTVKTVPRSETTAIPTNAPLPFRLATSAASAAATFATTPFSRPPSKCVKLPTLFDDQRSYECNPCMKDTQEIPTHDLCLAGNYKCTVDSDCNEGDGYWKCCPNNCDKLMCTRTLPI